jgi:hypothetical protein
MNFVGRRISQTLLSNEEQLARNFTTWRDRRTEAAISPTTPMNSTSAADQEADACVLEEMFRLM